MGKLKARILNNDPKLTQLLNCNSYTLLVPRGYLVRLRVFYTFERRREEMVRSVLQIESKAERVFWFDGEQLFFSLEVSMLGDRTRCCKLIFSQWDLEELFQVKFTSTKVRGMPVFFVYDAEIVKAAYEILACTS
jgi:hypothetical protein